MNNYDHLLNILIIGDQNVGKTCLLLKFSEQKFVTSHLATIGIDFKVKILQMNKKRLKLQIWDTAGQERFRNLTQTYYKGATGIILAYDCTSRDSFKHIRVWMNQIHNYASPGIVKILVSNKADIEDKEVTPDEGRTLAEEIGIPFFETSAKSGLNVDEIFNRMARKIIQKKLCHKQKSIKVTRSPLTQFSCCKR